MAISMVAIDKMDVLTENFSNISSLIEHIASDRQQLLEARNTWEVFFWGYDDDPREIPEIPEVINWCEQSVEAGIPWFYFMRTVPFPESRGLAAFLMCCAGVKDPELQGRFTFDEERSKYFIKKNMDNLADFVEKYDLPDEIGIKATDAAVQYLQDILFGEEADEEEDEADANKQTMFKEAAERLKTLEEAFGLNPKVRNYFEQGKLYYSYLTAGGIIGSIDTINYDRRYAQIVESFEDQTSYLVYHVIEHDDHIALLFVSDDPDNWQNERAERGSILAMDVNVETGDNQFGYIMPDVLQGALYLKTSQIYTERPGIDRSLTGLSTLEAEIAERLEILKNTGIETDLDITSIYLEQDEICLSLLRNVMAQPICVINTISTEPYAEQLAGILEEQFDVKIFFGMSSTEYELVFLYVDDRQTGWEAEKLALERKHPHAIVVDLNEGKAFVRRIAFEILNGGPIKTDDL